MDDAKEILLMIFFGSFFMAWFTNEISDHIWVTISAVVGLVIAILILIRLIRKGTA